MDRPKQKRRRRFAYTEEDMAVAFEAVLKSRKGIPGLGPFWRVFREVDCHRGRPDFVAIESKQKFRVDGDSLGFVAATILALLRPNAPRSLDYLVAKSGFSRASVTLAVRNLKRLGHIRQSRDRETFTFDESRSLFNVEVWAFELKLDKPKRAIFQAQQYRLFAQKVLIVVPPTQTPNYCKHHDTMKRWGIGLASFDPETNQFSLEVAPKWGEPVSKQQQIFALGRLLDRKAVLIRSVSSRSASRTRTPAKHGLRIRSAARTGIRRIESRVGQRRRVRHQSH